MTASACRSSTRRTSPAKRSWSSSPTRSAACGTCRRTSPRPGGGAGGANTSTGRSAWWMPYAACTRASRRFSTRPTPAGPREALNRSRGREPLDLSHQHQDDHDHQHQPERAARRITPTAAVGPGGNHAQHGEDEDYQQDLSKCLHGILPVWIYYFLGHPMGPAGSLVWTLLRP